MEHINTDLMQVYAILTKYHDLEMTVKQLIKHADREHEIDEEVIEKLRKIVNLD